MEGVVTKHIVQFYGKNERSLIADVGRYVTEGLKQGEGILAIATPSRVEQLMRRLKLQLPYSEAVQTGRFLCLDAQATLARIMVDGQPDWHRFEAVIRPAIETVHRSTGHPRLRLYGEMVDLLWKAERPAAANRLEEYWNTLLASQTDCQLFCAYPIDIWHQDFEPAATAPILCTHTQVLPVGEGPAFAVELAVEEVLGTSVDALVPNIDQSGRAHLPKALATILWLKEKQPNDADAVLRRAWSYYYDLE